MRQPIPILAIAGVALPICACVVPASTATYPIPGPSRPTPSNVYSPHSGITCDRAEQTCYDQRGADVSWTRHQFGEAAARRLEDRLARPPPHTPNRDPYDPYAWPAPAPVPDPAPRTSSIFPVEGGAYCDREIHACYTARGVASEHTRRQFGGAARQALLARADLAPDDSEAIFRSGRGFTCDRKSQVCYDRTGPSLQVTDTEFGHRAARQLARRLGVAWSPPPDARPQKNPASIYTPAAGIWCDRLVRACYHKSGAAPQYTQTQFGRDSRRRLEERMQQPAAADAAIFRSGRGVVCDRVSQVCYDPAPSPEITRAEFGRRAANKLNERLR